MEWEGRRKEVYAEGRLGIMEWNGMGGKERRGEERRGIVKGKEGAREEGQMARKRVKIIGVC